MSKIESFKKGRRLRVVDPSILEQIEQLKSRISKNPAYDLVLQHAAYHVLWVESVKHSVALESDIGKGKLAIIAEENLRSARAYFVRNYSGDLTHSFIMNLGELIEPSLRPVSYRGPSDPQTRANGDRPHIYPSNVSEQMDEFLLRNSSYDNPVRKAIHSHFHIARIHPFKDGNGRLARLVQNGILEKAGLPPIVIKKHDKTEYCDLLRMAEEEYEEYKAITPSQTLLFNYLAIKLHESLRGFEQRLSSKS